MSFDNKKREEIRKYILRKIASDDKDFIAKTMDSFGISVTTVKRYLGEAIACEAVEEQPKRACGYSLVEHVFEARVDLSGRGIEEDRLYALHIEKQLSHCNENALRIWQYTCAEILNNAIEHSRGKTIRIKVSTNRLNSSVVIVDDGVGIFQTLMECMKEHGWEQPSDEDALIELYKGKLTRMQAGIPERGFSFLRKPLMNSQSGPERKYVSGDMGRSLIQ